MKVFLTIELFERVRDYMSAMYLTNVVFEEVGTKASNKGFERFKEALLAVGAEGSVSDVIKRLGIKWHRSENFVGTFEHYEGFEVEENRVILYSDSKGIPDMAVYAIIARCLDLKHYVLTSNNYDGLFINTDLEGCIFKSRYVITNLDSTEKYDYAKELKYFYDSKVFSSLDSIFRFFKEELGITVPLTTRSDSFSEQYDYFKLLSFNLEKFQDYYFETEEKIKIRNIVSKYKKEHE